MSIPSPSPNDYPLQVTGVVHDETHRALCGLEQCVMKGVRKHLPSRDQTNTRPLDITKCFSLHGSSNDGKLLDGIVSPVMKFLRA